MKFTEQGGGRIHHDRDRDIVLGEVTEVPEKARRRTYTVEYKLQIVKEAEACKGPRGHPARCFDVKASTRRI